MLKSDFDNEWKFIASEINEKSFDEVGQRKREILFFMQILLRRIGISENEIEKKILTEKYAGLKGGIEND
jgi:hypothetical protein